jgi:hypothetical protein
MELKKITEDYSVVTREFDVEDFVGMELSRHYRDRKRGKPRPHKRGPNRDRSKEYKRCAKLRRVRVRKGLCTSCPVRRVLIPTEGYRMCESCRIRYRIINARCRAKEIFQLTRHALSIDQD